jgi:hypothetical protein
VRSSFEEFIKTNLMVQSEFNLVFWFVSYNIFSSLNKWGPHWYVLSLLLSHARVGSSVVEVGQRRIADTE